MFHYKGYSTTAHGIKQESTRGNIFFQIGDASIGGIVDIMLERSENCDLIAIGIPL